MSSAPAVSGEAGDKQYKFELVHGEENEVGKAESIILEQVTDLTADGSGEEEEDIVEVDTDLPLSADNNVPPNAMLMTDDADVRYTDNEGVREAEHHWVSFGWVVFSSE